MNPSCYLEGGIASEGSRLIGNLGYFEKMIIDPRAPNRRGPSRMYVYKFRPVMR
jgi:hypothetical protein